MGNNFLNRIPMAKMNKWDYMKLKSFCTAKEAFTTLKRQLTEWEKPLSAIYLTRD
jgi:hypothetical protein